MLIYERLNILDSLHIMCYITRTRLSHNDEGKKKKKKKKTLASIVQKIQTCHMT